MKEAMILWPSKSAMAAGIINIARSVGKFAQMRSPDNNRLRSGKSHVAYELMSLGHTLIDDV